MLTTKNSPHLPVIIWLASGCLLVAVMVIVGGITRLTHSGLSMVQWNLFMGSIPPIGDQAWNDTFDLYKQTPEFRLKNYDFSLSEFKSIFWWEYFHRMIGRMIGLIFIVPFTIFLIQKKFDQPFVKKLLIILGLGALQGFMGWYMVKSGLVKDPNVSHYRLAMHLILAFALYAITFWLMLEKIFAHKARIVPVVTIHRLVVFLLLILGTQIMFGAFVSGLKAGAIYNTFPMMGSSWVAESVTFTFQKHGWISLFENPASVQFVHRCLAYVVVVITGVIWWKTKNESLSTIQINGLYLLVTAISFQILLGIFTLLLAVPIWMGVLHQFGALILLTSLIYFYYTLRLGRSDTI